MTVMPFHAAAALNQSPFGRDNISSECKDEQRLPLHF